MLACAPSHSVTRHLSKSTTLLLVVSIAAALVVLRALPYLLFEQLAFDSDQAIVGLMAKHLVERRAFPLFFYGQTYMLAVEAWAAAPFLLVGGASITTLRLSILAWNIAFIVLLIVALRDDGVDGWWILAPAALAALAAPSVATQLMAAQGGIAEPFVWVIALWLLRRRPLWFGVVLAIGFRNREFTAYAIPPLLAVEWVSGEMTGVRLRQWLAAAVMFVVAWQVVEALKPFADLLGPGTRGQLVGGFAGSQIENLVQRADFDPSGTIARAQRLLPEIFRWFAGAQQIDTTLPIATPRWLAWIAAALLAATVVRLVVVITQQSDGDPSGRTMAPLRARARAGAFPLYLSGVGAVALLAFVASKPVLVGYSRYSLLGLLLPVGLVAGLLALERSAFARTVTAALVAAWAGFIACEHVLIAARYIRDPPPNQRRAIVDQLLADGTATAKGSYWQAYALTFVAREQVRVASSDFVRILEYEEAFDRDATHAATLSDVPCPGGRYAGGVYICRQ